MQWCCPPFRQHIARRASGPCPNAARGASIGRKNASSSVMDRSRRKRVGFDAILSPTQSTPPNPNQPASRPSDLNRSDQPLAPNLRMVVLPLDEPFEGIDPASSAVLEMLFGQLSRSDTTILLTSHILSVVRKIATRAVIERHESEPRIKDLRQHSMSGIEKLEQQCLSLKTTGCCIIESTPKLYLPTRTCESTSLVQAM